MHAHFLLNTPGLFFWVETSAAPAPVAARGRTAQNPKPKAHPFNIAPDFSGEKRTVTLQLAGVTIMLNGGEITLFMNWGMPSIIGSIKHQRSW